MNEMNMDYWFQQFLGSEDEDEDYYLALGSLGRPTSQYSSYEAPTSPRVPETASETVFQALSGIKESSSP